VPTSGSQWLTLTPLAGEKGGYATMVSVPEGVSEVTFDLTGRLPWGQGFLMVGPPGPHWPGLFSGITIMRL